MELKSDLMTRGRWVLSVDVLVSIYIAPPLPKASIYHFGGMLITAASSRSRIFAPRFILWFLIV